LAYLLSILMYHPLQLIPNIPTPFCCPHRTPLEDLPLRQACLSMR
jgi:hypothetical protein